MTQQNSQPNQQNQPQPGKSGQPNQMPTSQARVADNRDSLATKNKTDIL